MRLKSFEYSEPKSVEEACSLLAEHGERAKVIGGGTDLLVRMKHGVTTPGILVDLRRVEGLSAISEDGPSVRIGATATLTDIRKSEIVRREFPILAEAALGVGAAQLQNMGTLAGNLCLEPRCWFFQQSPAWREARHPCFKNNGDRCYMAKGAKRCYALYCGDTAAALLALGAHVKLASSRGGRILALESFFVDDGKGHTVLARGEFLSEIVVLKKASCGGTYLKYRKRGALDFPIVGVGAVVSEDAGRRDARVAVTGAGSAPFVVAAPGLLDSPDAIERLAEAAGKQAKPVSHMDVSTSYRKQLVRVLTKDALEKLKRFS